MSFPAYSDYVESQADWLGKVPTHWAVRRLGFHFRERREKVSDKEYPPLSVTKNGVVPQIETAAKTDDGDNRKKVCKGDFVINSRSDRKGSSGVSALDGSVSLINTVLTPLQSVDGKFAHYLFRSVPFQEEFYRYGKGIVADLWSTSFSEMRNIRLAIPEVCEQQCITSFLDRETFKTDALVSQQEKLIELLKEKRQAVISQAVTKGLDPGVKMKNSGIDWLGNVPEHWGVKALKHIVQVPITDGPHETPDFVDEGIPFVSAEGISNGYVDFSKIRGYIATDVHERYSKKYHPQKGDIYMVKSGATTGVCAIVETDQEFNIWSPLAAIRCSDEINPYFLLFLMRSTNFQQAVTLNWSFGTQQNIGMGVIENLYTTIPPRVEQDQIAELLLSETMKFDKLENEAKSTITLLAERRSALIAAAVTGKFDVRSFQ